MTIRIQKEGETGVTGSHFKLHWDMLEQMLRGDTNVPLPLLGEEERIKVIKSIDDQGILICIGDRNEETL